MLVPASLAIVIEAFTSDRRAHAIGLWGATAAVAAGLGPPMGGALVELGGWRWAFLINLPFGVLAIVATRSTVVESRAPGRRVLPDIPGALLLAGALALLNLGIIKGNDWGWSSPLVLGSFLLAALLTALFVRSSLRHRAPVVDPALMGIGSFRTASAATVLAGLGFYAYLLTNILWLQYVWGYDVLRAGLALVPGSLVAAVVAARLGPHADSGSTGISAGQIWRFRSLRNRAFCRGAASHSPFCQAPIFRSADLRLSCRRSRVNTEPNMTWT